MRLGIIGSGTVGLATSTGLAKFEHTAIFNDTNSNVLFDLQRRGYTVQKDIEELIKSTDVSFVCVPTPNSRGRQNLSFLKKTITDIAEALKGKSEYHLVAIRSTILPGTMRKIVLPLFKRYIGSGLSERFGLCYNPEFLREANAFEDFLHPSRIIIGEMNQKSGDVLQQLYRPFGVPIIRTDFDTAEMIKYVSNTFLATKISFFNEVHEICQKLNIDDRVVSEAVSLDPRIGSYGIYGGKAFGGKCLPKDLAAFVSFISELKVNPDLLYTVLTINEKMRQKESF